MLPSPSASIATLSIRPSPSVSIATPSAIPSPFKSTSSPSDRASAISPPKSDTAHLIKVPIMIITF